MRNENVMVMLRSNRFMTHWSKLCLSDCESPDRVCKLGFHKNAWHQLGWSSVIWLWSIILYIPLDILKFTIQCALRWGSGLWTWEYVRSIRHNTPQPYDTSPSQPRCYASLRNPNLHTRSRESQSDKHNLDGWVMNLLLFNITIIFSFLTNCVTMKANVSWRHRRSTYDKIE